MGGPGQARENVVGGVLEMDLVILFLVLVAIAWLRK